MPTLTPASAPISTPVGLVIREPHPSELPATRDLMIETVARDYGYDFREAWHEDIADLAGFFLAHPRQTLLVAIDGLSGQILGTAGVRVFQATAPPHPADLVAHYAGGRTAELTRVFVRPDARRRGIGRALVKVACQRIATLGGYDLIQLHSRTAVEFWRALPTQEILDNRQSAGAGADRGQAYFELPLVGGTVTLQG